MNMQLVLPPEYIRQATDLINKAERRVSLIAMVIADHEATHELIEALKAAAQRGVKVTVAADVVTYGEVSGSFLPVRYYSIHAREATAMAKKLKESGVRFYWLGHGRMTILNGRTHSKWCVVDDTVFSFGGVNIYQEGIESNDYMLRTESAALGDRLVDELQRIRKAERTATNYGSAAHELDNQTILFDGGIITQSIIYRRACELAELAKEVTFVSQYCPTGKLARILKKRPHQLFFNNPEQAKGVNRALIRLNMFITGFRTAYLRDTYLHAKCIIFTMKNGSKVAITGSHNFAYASVFFGTREVALETKDPAIIKQLETFITDYVA